MKTNLIYTNFLILKRKLNKYVFKKRSAAKLRIEQAVKKWFKRINE